MKQYCNPINSQSFCKYWGGFSEVCTSTGRFISGGRSRLSTQGGISGVCTSTGGSSPGGYSLGGFSGGGVISRGLSPAFASGLLQVPGTFQVPTLKAARTSSYEKGFRWMTTEWALDLPLPNAGRRPPLVAAAPLTSLVLFDLTDFIICGHFQGKNSLSASRASVR